MNESENTLLVYEHEKRPHWGMAILAWERGAKRGYLFEDGTLRAIGEPYYHLMKLKQTDRASLCTSFRHQLARMNRAKAEGMLDPSRGSNPLFSVEEQAELLVAQFEGGFQGEAWRHRHRSQPTQRQRLKRHRDGALEDAKKALDPKRVAQAVTDQKHGELWTELSELLKSTDLVTPRDLAVLERRVSRADRELTIALSALLHGDASEETNGVGDRFAVFVRELTRVLGKAPSWPLATSLPALYAPRRFLSVHPTSLRQQGKWLNESPLRKNPNPADFERVNRLAHNLFEQLERLGLSPADLFDIHDFVRATTTPAAKKRLEALRQTDASNHSPPSSSNADGDHDASGEEAA